MYMFNVCMYKCICYMDNVCLTSFPGSPSSASMRNMTFDPVEMAEGEPGRFWYVNDVCDLRGNTFFH